MSKIEVNEIDAQSGNTITVGSACKSVAVPGNVVKTNAIQASDAGNIISQSGTTITIGAIRRYGIISKWCITIRFW